MLLYSPYVLKSSPLNREALRRESGGGKFPRVTVNIFKHFRLYSCEVYYRNINKRKSDKKAFRIGANFLSSAVMCWKGWKGWRCCSEKGPSDGAWHFANTLKRWLSRNCYFVLRNDPKLQSSVNRELKCFIFDVDKWKYFYCPESR